MVKKQSKLIFLIILVVSSQFFLTKLIFAQNPNQKEKVINVNKLEQRLNELEKRVCITEKSIFKYEPELCAAKKLLEISEKNLTAPNYMNAILIGLTLILGGIVLFIVRNGILKDTENKIIHYVGSIEDIKMSMQQIEKDHSDLLAAQFQRASTERWGKERYNEAIEFSEKAVSYLVSIFGKQPEEPTQKNRFNKYRSELAYFYAEDGRTDKIGEAVEFAKLGLETGENTDDLNLIDNYLFVIMKFSQSPEDKRQWMSIFEIYKNRIYKAEIRKKGDEQKEYDDHYDKLRAEKHQAKIF